eukprot:1703850-Amphidinium_carterae.1
MLRLKVPFIVSALAIERICVSNASQCFFVCAISRSLAANFWSYLFFVSDVLHSSLASSHLLMHQLSLLCKEL